MVLQFTRRSVVSLPTSLHTTLPAVSGCGRGHACTQQAQPVPTQDMGHLGPPRYLLPTLHTARMEHRLPFAGAAGGYLRDGAIWFLGTGGTKLLSLLPSFC